MARSKAVPAAAPTGTEWRQVVVSHSVEDRHVYISIEVPVQRLVLTPEQAHEIGATLIRRAEMALGRSPS